MLAAVKTEWLPSVCGVLDNFASCVMCPLASLYKLKKLHLPRCKIGERRQLQHARTNRRTAHPPMPRLLRHLPGQSPDQPRADADSNRQCRLCLDW
jgi:hypothetical protein